MNSDCGESFEEILDLAKSGNDDAIALLYRGHAPMVKSYFTACRHFEPEDLTSEVFIGMLRTLRNFSGSHDDFKSWLMTIAHRRLIDDRRKRRPTTVDPLTQLDQIADADAEVECLGRSEIDPRLISAFPQLTDAQREVLVLRFVTDLSQAAVAEITQRPVNVVKSLQHRGLESLRRQIPELQLTALKNR